MADAAEPPDFATGLLALEATWVGTLSRAGARWGDIRGDRGYRHSRSAAPREGTPRPFLRTSLALSYDSGAGNGPFGPGRHLDSRRCCARVLRKTGKGLPWGASPGGGGVRSGFITP
ncbi:SpvB/TcaC N-terminal domain-containing protein [Streptomyces sp. NPDC004546]|uniref:SpvB/TcaC N-terminal domain-containing protein n=1 Tax=unclassified Streptomyces TaxID=2593676 RepID=UPI0033B9DB7B